MAKINNNGQTIAESPTKKNSAKKTSNAIENTINKVMSLTEGSMDPKVRENAQTIATIISMF